MANNEDLSYELKIMKANFKATLQLFDDKIDEINRKISVLQQDLIDLYEWKHSNDKNFV